MGTDVDVSVVAVKALGGSQGMIPSVKSLGLEMCARDLVTMGCGCTVKEEACGVGLEAAGDETEVGDEEEDNKTGEREMVGLRQSCGDKGGELV